MRDVKKTTKILHVLHQTPKDVRLNGYMRESELGRVSFAFLQSMYFDGLIDGAGLRDEKGTGNYKHTRLWCITDKGLDTIFGA